MMDLGVLHSFLGLGGRGIVWKSEEWEGGGVPGCGERGREGHTYTCIYIYVSPGVALPLSDLCQPLQNVVYFGSVV